MSLWNNNQEAAASEEAQDTEEGQEGNSLADVLGSLSNEKLAHLAKQWREKRRARPGDRQIRDEYIAIQKELARRGASS